MLQLTHMKVQGIQATGGFTLVEVGLVLAISGLLLAGIIANSNGSQSNSAFTTAIDTLQNTTKEVQNQASATITERTGGQTGDSPYVIFAKAMLFNPASPTTYTVATLIGKPDDAIDPLEECDDPAVALPDGITYRGVVSKAIIFQDDPNQIYAASGYSVSQPPNGVECSSPGLDTGLRNTTPFNWSTVMATLSNPLNGPLANSLTDSLTNSLNWLIPPAHAAGSDILDVNNYTPTGPFSGNLNFAFVDPASASHLGKLTVDPSTNTITRSYNY